jgi:hypothetical protein
MLRADCGLKKQATFNPYSAAGNPSGNFSTVTVENPVEKSLFDVTSS